MEGKLAGGAAGVTAPAAEGRVRPPAPGSRRACCACCGLLQENFQLVVITHDEQVGHVLFVCTLWMGGVGWCWGWCCIRGAPCRMPMPRCFPSPASLDATRAAAAAATAVCAADWHPRARGVHVANHQGRAAALHHHAGACIGAGRTGWCALTAGSSARVVGWPGAGRGSGWGSSWGSSRRAWPTCGGSVGCLWRRRADDWLESPWPRPTLGAGGYFGVKARPAPLAALVGTAPHVPTRARTLS